MSQQAWQRQMTWLDAPLTELGLALRVLSGAVQAARPYPGTAPEAAAVQPTADGSAAQAAREVGRLMRVNHVGEVCAQALYRGQALGCADASARAVFRQAASEEVDHLAWCRQRLAELHDRPSVLNPLWYLGAFGLGVVASRASVGHNLGFMAETERQVEQHLDGHLQRLPRDDQRTRQVLVQMRSDEAGHRRTAQDHGGQRLPAPVRGLMRAMSWVMTTTAARI